MTAKQLTRIYVVKQQGKPDRLVRAVSQSQAMSHVIKPQVSAAVAEPDELVALTLGGTKVEEAKAE